MTLDDPALAAELATAAGRLLMDLRAEGRLQGPALGDAGDAQANAWLIAQLKAARPDDAVLSEEGARDPARLGCRRVWIIDPLDGTREYCEPGRSDWAVHVALTEAGCPGACAVSLPALGLTFGTASPPPLPPAPRGRLKILVSRTRAPALAERVAEALGAELVPMGSAGAKAMAVLRGEAHAYLHDGGMNEWDTCAPVGVARAAGLHASRIDGSTCLYNRADVAMPDLLICRPELAQPLLAAIAAALGRAA